ncbi:MAG: NAD(P)/FAD-dependent oxidoreductase [Spirulinaceae cyanobacterium SM2_1_0]|nr:NAD(P)/FAD-dependent oxidoreductase [Spirulinaceae cyanobacterium SM2_1_0]
MGSEPLAILVVGGGAAGFFGAIAAAEAGGRVTLLEAAREPLGKVRISGGGRCNVTHHCFEPAQLVQQYPRGSKALRGAFSRFQPRDTIAWFAARGVDLKVEADGRMFPVSDRSETIVQCLQTAAARAGVQVRTHAPVASVTRTPSGLQIALKRGEELRGDRLLLATGSNPAGWRWAAALGHTIQPPVPSLFTFRLDDPRLTDLAGVSVPVAALTLRAPSQKLVQSGPLLVTHWGLSGPAVLKLSAWGARLLHAQRYRLPLQINWLPGQNAEQLRQQLLALKSNQPRRQIASAAPVDLPKRLWQKLITAADIAPGRTWAELSKRSLQLLLQELTRGEYQITGKGIFKEEFVTCGGVKLAEVDFKTMASGCCPGLYFAGEILDIDGVTGGFNFQSAWTTGWLAGQALAQRA